MEPEADEGKADEPLPKSLEFLGLCAVIFSSVGCYSIPYAWFNLIGVPMLDPHAMDAARGWMAVAVALGSFAFVAAILTAIVRANKPPP